MHMKQSLKEVKVSRPETDEKLSSVFIRTLLPVISCNMKMSPRDGSRGQGSASDACSLKTILKNTLKKYF